MQRFNPRLLHKGLAPITSLRDYSTDLDYQFMQRSKIPMLHFQPSLPRLPIPLLEKTCERYLAAQRPLLDNADYEHTQKVTEAFRQGVGMELQKLLKDKDAQNKHTSYISEPWFHMYLADRAPLPINYNPLMMMKHDERPEYNDQLLRAANMVVSSLRFLRSLRAECLEPEVFHMNAAKSDTERFRNVARLTPKIVSTYVAYAFKAFPLDMSQYQGLFNGTRVPETGKDRIYRQPKAKHVLVVRNGNFFAVDVLDQSGNILPAAQILQRLSVVLDSQQPAAEFPIGVLTTENRDNWAALRPNLVAGNPENMELIDSAIFCLCLDNSTFNPSNETPMIRGFLFGEAHNRWFDKSVSLMVAADGTTGVNFEHSWGDGVAVLRYFQELFKETTKRPHLHPADLQTINRGLAAIEGVRSLQFQLDDHAKAGIVRAKERHAAVSNSLDLNIMKLETINRNICKKSKISPDSVMQLGFQLAFYKQHRKFVGTYESCSTAAFRHGRTETMRPLTVATREFCEQISQPTTKRKSTQELRAIMEQCSQRHNQLTKDAAMGQGFDRHLFGLKHTAQENNMPLPDLYKDPAYGNINHNVISTSTLSSPALLAGGFGPVVSDGYGIAYNIQDSYLGSVVTSYKGQRDGTEFVECLKEAYSDIAEVLLATAGKTN